MNTKSHFIICILASFFLFFSCVDTSEYNAQTTSGGSSSSGSTSGGSGDGGFVPTGDDTPESPETPGSSVCTTPSDTSKYGGITCGSGSHTDQNFRDFLSSGNQITGGVQNFGTIGPIDCQPSNNGGMLFQARVLVSGQFNPSGENSNLTCMTNLSSLNFLIRDVLVTEDLRNNRNPKEIINGRELGQLVIGSATDPSNPPIPLTTCNINGDRATLTFADRVGSVTFEGSFNAQNFTGQVSFQNKVKTVLKRDDDCPAGGPNPCVVKEQVTISGSLGTFNIPTCNVFYQSGG